MKQQMNDLFKNCKRYLKKRSPEILTGIGLVGMISSTVLAVTATPKAIKLIEKKKEEMDTDKLKPIDIVKAAWKPYIPSIGIGLTSIGCIIFSSKVNYKRNAALATAYTMSEKALIRYKDKVVETIGERKEKNIREELAQDEVNSRKVSESTVILTTKGNTLCLDKMSGRYFRSDIESIKKVINKLNRDLTYQNYISLNDYYYELGLDGIRTGSLMGWNLDSGLIDPSFSTCLAENDEPCIVIDFMVEPRYDFDKLI